jgi:hypothetical protein
MAGEGISEAVVAAIKDSAIPRVDGQKLAEIYGPEEGSALANQVLVLVREAVASPIEWGDKNLQQGVEDIMSRFGESHPDLSAEALYEIGRCVGWNLR